MDNDGEYIGLFYFDSDGNLSVDESYVAITTASLTDSTDIDLLSLDDTYVSVTSIDEASTEMADLYPVEDELGEMDNALSIQSQLDVMTQIQADDSTGSWSTEIEVDTLIAGDIIYSGSIQYLGESEDFKLALENYALIFPKYPPADGQVLGIARSSLKNEPFTYNLEWHTPKEAQMFTVSNILIVAVIALIVSKWIAPKLTLSVAFRAFIRLILKPFKRAEKTVEKEWKEANKKEGGPL